MLTIIFYLFIENHRFCFISKFIETVNLFYMKQFIIDAGHCRHEM